MTEQDTEVLALLKKLASEYTETLAAHKAALDRHEANMIAAHKLAENYGLGIRANREALEGLAELVNVQTRAFNVMREVVLKTYEHCFGPDQPAEFPTQIQ